MASITETIKGSNPAAKPKADERKPLPQVPIRTLQAFLKDAYDAEKASLEPASPVFGGFTVGTTDAAISITLLSSDGRHEYAGINDTKMHYSGSLVKVAALYAALDIRAEARLHAATQTFGDTPAFLNSLKNVVNPTGAIGRLRAMTVGLNPVLKDILVGFAPSGTDRVNFTEPYKGHLIDILHNAGARGVIRPLGYSYINVSLMRGRFFEPDETKPDGLHGLWLAGDYSGDLPKAQRLPVSRVPVLNDTVAGGSAQAMTTREMSRMFREVHLKEAYGHIPDSGERANANQGVHAILQSQLSFFFDTGDDAQMTLTETPAFSNVIDPADPSKTHCAKVGIGSLGDIKPTGGTTGPSVFSEGAVMRWNAIAEKNVFNTSKSRQLTGEFVLVWQNMYHKNSRWDALVRVVNTTIKNFLTQP